MRLSVAVAGLCLSVVGLCVADDVKASIRKPTHIAAESLVVALKQLAHERGFQMVFQSEIVGAAQTHGAVGEFTPDEALKQLLKGTGLSYRYLDERTVTIIPLSMTSGAPGEAATALSTSTPPPSQQGDSKSLWNNFLLAQATPGQTSGPASVAAQTSNSQENSTPGALQEVIVTAQKRAERLQDVPISISVLGAQDLDRSTLSGVTEALNLVPGVSANVGVQGGGTQITIRGVGASEPLFNGSSPIGYYLDSAPFGLVKTAILPDSDIYDLERVEVLRGPQGTLYGANAENGLVRVLTNDANLDQFQLKSRATVSNTEDGGGNYWGDVAVNVPLIEGKLAIRGVVDYTNSSGWINSPVDTHVNDSELRTFRLKINAQPTDQLSIGLSAWTTRDNFGAPSTSDDDRMNYALISQPIHSG